MKKFLALAFVGLAIGGAMTAPAQADDDDVNPAGVLGGVIAGGMLGGMLVQQGGAYVVPAPTVLPPPVAVLPQPAYGYPYGPAYGYPYGNPVSPPPVSEAYPAYQQPAYPAPYPYGEREDDDD